MPSKKSERKAAAKGTTAEARREQKQERDNARHEAHARAATAQPQPPTDPTQQLVQAVQQSQSFDDLWDNPMVRAARAQMTPEQIAEYERLGRQMYGTVDFENVDRDLENEEMNALEYIETALRSGLRPCDLDENEQKFMEDAYGEAWYEQYGGFGKPLPGAELENVLDARKKNEDAFFRAFGGKRFDLVKELDGQW